MIGSGFEKSSLESHGAVNLEGMEKKQAVESGCELPDDSGDSIERCELPDDSGDPIERSELPDDSGDSIERCELPDDSGDSTERCELPDDSGDMMPDLEGEVDEQMQQDIANTAAQAYNEKYQPYQRALRKNIAGVIETPNGGVSFRNSDVIYIKNDGTKCIVTIEASGDRTVDFDRANSLLDLKETPDGYVWHHVDDYNVKTNTITLELVKDEAHNATKPHAGGCAQYDAIYGSNYNPPKKGV